MKTHTEVIPETTDPADDIDNEISPKYIIEDVSKKNNEESAYSRPIIVPTTEYPIELSESSLTTETETPSRIPLVIDNERDFIERNIMLLQELLGLPVASSSSKSEEHSSTTIANNDMATFPATARGRMGRGPNYNENQSAETDVTDPGFNTIEETQYQTTTIRDQVKETMTTGKAPETTMETTEKQTETTTRLTTTTEKEIPSTTTTERVTSTIKTTETTPKTTTTIRTSPSTTTTIKTSPSTTTTMSTSPSTTTTESTTKRVTTTEGTTKTTPQVTTTPIATTTSTSSTTTTTERKPTKTQKKNSDADDIAFLKQLVSY